MLLPSLPVALDFAQALAVTPTTLSVPSQFFGPQAVQNSLGASETLTNSLPPPPPPPVVSSSTSFDHRSYSVATTIPGTPAFLPTKSSLSIVLSPPTHASVPTKSSLSIVLSPPTHASVPTKSSLSIVLSPPTHASVPTKSSLLTTVSASRSPMAATREGASSSRISSRSSTLEKQTQYYPVDSEAPTSTTGVGPSASSDPDAPLFSNGTITSQSSASTRASTTHVVLITLIICSVFTFCILLAGVLFYLRVRSLRRRSVVRRDFKR